MSFASKLEQGVATVDNPVKDTGTAKSIRSCTIRITFAKSQLALNSQSFLCRSSPRHM